MVQKTRQKKVDCTHAVNDGSRKHHQQERERKRVGGERSVEIFTEYFHTLGGQFARSYFFLPCMFSKALHYVFISFTFNINYNWFHITLPHTGE